jgi:hypothetical protein
MNIVWYLCELEYERKCKAGRHRNDILFRQSFFFIVRKMTIEIPLKQVGVFAAAKCGRKMPFGHASVLNGIRGAQQDFGRRDLTSLDWVKKTERILGKADIQLMRLNAIKRMDEKSSDRKAVQKHQLCATAIRNNTARHFNRIRL